MFDNQFLLDISWKLSPLNFPFINSLAVQSQNVTDKLRKYDIKILYNKFSFSLIQGPIFLLYSFFGN